MLLHLHQPVHALLVHHVLVDEVGEELEVQLDHLEVDEPRLQQFGVDLLELLDLLADADAEADDAVDLGVGARQFLVEEGVVGGDLVDEVVEDLGDDVLVGLAGLDGGLAVLGELLDGVEDEVLLEGERLVGQALHLALVAELQVPQLVDEPIVDVLVPAVGDQLSDLLLDRLVALPGVVEVEQALLLAVDAVQVEDVLVVLLVPRVQLVRLELLLEVVEEVVELAGRGVAGRDEDPLLLLYEVLDADVDYH